MQVRRCTLHQLRYQLHSVEGRAKCPTVPQLCGLVIGTRVAGQGSKYASKVICLFVFMVKLTALSSRTDRANALFKVLCFKW